jgi:hypothetical protein
VKLKKFSIIERGRNLITLIINGIVSLQKVYSEIASEN